MYFSVDEISLPVEPVEEFSAKSRQIGDIVIKRETEESRFCEVCGGPGDNFHLGSTTCRACRVFHEHMTQNPDPGLKCQAEGIELN